MTAHAVDPTNPEPATTAARRERPSRRRPTWTWPSDGLSPLHVAAMFLAGVALRAYVLQSPLGGFDADEATSSLVSRQVLDGNFPAFIRPLHHGGTLLAYPRAPFLALFHHTIKEGFAAPEHAGLLVVEKEPDALLDAMTAWTPPLRSGA